jgi:hypothetical protein
MTFDETKTDTLNLRVSPTFKATLKAVADAEHRSMVNMLEVLLADYCEQRDAPPALAHRTQGHSARRTASPDKLIK